MRPDAAYTSQSRISHVFTSLEKRGWVRREKCTDDTRGTRAVLTTRGMRALTTAAPTHVRQVRESVFDHLTKEQVTQWEAISSAILAGVDPRRRPSHVGSRS